MPPTKPTYQVFKVIAREDLVAYQEAERQATAERLIEIEEGLIVKDDVYLCMHELMTNPSLKKICKMIMSYLINHLGSRIRILRHPLFPKPVSWSGLFLPLLTVRCL